MPHVRKGDLVVVIGGSNKGKRGKILRVDGQRLVFALDVEQCAIGEVVEPAHGTAAAGVIAGQR